MKNKKFETKTVTTNVRYYDPSVCLVFNELTIKQSKDIGIVLQNQMVCEKVAVEWNGLCELWLEGFDFGLWDDKSFEDLLIEVCKELGYNIIIE